MLRERLIEGVALSSNLEMFRNKRDVTVSGGNFTQVIEGLNGRQILLQSRYVVHGAIHDSGQRYPPSECHPGTRENILQIALDWVNEPAGEDESQIFWLSGPAGVGKTAIAQSLCQLLKELGRLGGDFFISRSVAGHSDLHTLIPTLACQLAETYPEFGHELDAIIKANASILTKNMELQLQRLIINPLQQMQNKLNNPLILVIDGLDEAGGENEQISLLRLLGLNFLGHHLPLKIFLTSRPEPWIKSAFDDTSLLGSSDCHFLHRTSETDNDIRTVLDSGFTKIQETHDLMKKRSVRWPSYEVIDDIVDRASGQFIYVSTILRYVGDSNGNPTERLQRIIDMPTNGNHDVIDSPFLALDNLYKHVLSTSLNIDNTLAILGVLIASFEPVEDSNLTFTSSGMYSDFDMLPPIDGDSQVRFPAQPSSPPLRQLRQTRSNANNITSDSLLSFSISRLERILGFRPGDGFRALRTIQSLVDVSSDSEDGVNFYHKSFQDFLLDSNRAGNYFVDIKKANTKLIIWILRFLRYFGQLNSECTPHQIDTSDLKIMEERWMAWWLRSAASDQGLLLKEIKAIDPIVFYRKPNHEKKDSSAVSHRRRGTVADLISWETNKRIHCERGIG